MQWDITQLLEKERNMLSELSQTEKDKYGMVSLICGVLKKKSYSQKQWVGWWLPEAQGYGKKGEADKKCTHFYL